MATKEFPKEAYKEIESYTGENLRKLSDKELLSRYEKAIDKTETEKEVERRVKYNEEIFLSKLERKFIYRLRDDTETGEIIYKSEDLSISLINLILNKDDIIAGRKINMYNVIKALIDCYCFKTIGDTTKNIYFYDKGYYKPQAEDLIKKCLQSGLSYYLRNIHVNEIISAIKRETFISIEQMDVFDPYLVCLENGIYNIKKKCLEEHSSDYLFIQQLPLKYNPKSECPKFFKLLKDILEPDDIPCVQEYMGFCLFRKYSFKKAMILLGARDTGKTTLLNIFNNLIGSQNIAGVSLQAISHDKFATSFLRGKILNIVDDLSSQDVNSTGTFKMATGGGYITGEEKFKDRFQFMNYAKHIFATNKIMGVKDSDDEAYFSRWLIIPFNNQFIGKDAIKDYSDTICTEEEKSGILNWMIEGYYRLIKNGDFNYMRSPEENKLIMERSASSISYFIQECLQGGKWDDWIPKDDMYNTYKAFVKSNGGYTESKEKFGRDLPKKADWINSGQKDIGDRHGVHGWRSVKLSEHGLTTFTPF